MGKLPVKPRCAVLGIFPIVNQEDQHGCTVELGTQLQNEGPFLFVVDIEKRIAELETEQPDLELTYAQIDGTH
jgi:hypothetical protein